jgi:hypothetical protein
MHATVCCKGSLSRISMFIIIDAISISYHVEYFRHKFTRAGEIERQDKIETVV